MIDFQTRFHLHVEASVRRDAHARRALDLFEQGKDKEAMVAAKKAEHWDAKAKAMLDRNES